MSKKPQINLSKCKAGQKVRLRNGETSIFLGCRESQTYPYSTDFGSYQKNGRFFNSRETEYDIVAILPEPKTKPAQTGLTAKQRQNLQRAMKLIQEVLA